MLYVSALAAVLALSACATAPATGTAADETAIRGVAGKYADAFNKSDASGLSTLVAEDYHAILPDGTIVKGRAAFEELQKESVTRRAGLAAKLNVQTTTVDWLSASSAVASGTYTLSGVPGAAEKGAWMSVMKKGDDGQWRLWTGLVAEDVLSTAPGK
jgi:uncharacterized protein (TIGR02246 family)